MISLINPEFTPIPARPEQLQRLSQDLVKVGERLEKNKSDDWLIVARAAALLDGLRIDLVEVPHGRQ